jgi:hypothetical protein
MEEFGIRYMVWLDGFTETSGRTGSISCTVGPGGAGCFGFGSWEDDSNFDARVWDVGSLQNVGTISTDATGQSYVPALVIPIPLIARVEANALHATRRPAQTVRQRRVGPRRSFAMTHADTLRPTIRLAATPKLLALAAMLAAALLQGLRGKSGHRRRQSRANDREQRKRDWAGGTPKSARVYERLPR